MLLHPRTMAANFFCHAALHAALACSTASEEILEVATVSPGLRVTDWHLQRRLRPTPAIRSVNKARQQVLAAAALMIG